VFAEMCRRSRLRLRAPTPLGQLLKTRRVQLRLHAGVALLHSVVAYPVLAASFTFRPRYTDT
jgi:hypothetical protein